MICPECKTDKNINIYEDGYWMCSECKSDGNIDDDSIVYREYKISQPKYHLKVTKNIS